MGSSREITVVFINGWFNPTGWEGCNLNVVPSNVNMVFVWPSPTGSLHDRACQIFYELKGGTVDYGKEHSEYHDHNRYGRHYSGKLTQWDAGHPVYLVGHSFGGCTARVLQNYLAMGMFPGHNTDSSWVRGIICANSPINGSLLVYNNGLNLSLPPVVRCGSIGYQMSLVAHFTELFGLNKLSKYLDYQLCHFNLHWDQPHALAKLMLGILGYGTLATGSDSGAWDLSVHGQLHWSKLLRSFPGCHYASIAGNVNAVPPILLGENIIPSMIKMWIWEAVPHICGVDTSFWMHSGCDGAISKHTQEYPRLLNSADSKCRCCAHASTSSRSSSEDNGCSSALSESFKWDCNHCFWPRHLSRPDPVLAEAAAREYNKNSLNLEDASYHQGTWRDVPERTKQTAEVCSSDDGNTTEDSGGSDSTGATNSSDQEDTGNDENEEEEKCQPNHWMERGLWHYMDSDRSHFSPMQGCEDTWKEIIGIILIMDSHPPVEDDAKQANLLRERAEMRSKSIMRKLRPDLHNVDLNLHHGRHLNNIGMAFRWSRVLLAIILFAALYCAQLIPSGVMSLPSYLWNCMVRGILPNELAVFVAGFCVLLAIALFHLSVGLVQGKPHYNTRNSTFLWSDAIEVTYAIYRLYTFCDFSSQYVVNAVAQTSTTAAAGSVIDQMEAVANNSHVSLLVSFVHELALLYLVPRPIYDYNRPVLRLLLVCLLLYVPENAALVSELPQALLYYMSLFLLLPKLTWTVLYFTHLPCFEDIEGYVGMCVSWSCLVQLMTAWGTYTWRLCQLFMHTSNTQVPIQQQIPALLTFLLLAILPLNKVLEMSECIQFVMIKHKYHNKTVNICT